MYTLGSVIYTVLTDGSEQDGGRVYREGGVRRDSSSIYYRFVFKYMLHICIDGFLHLH